MSDLKPSIITALNDSGSYSTARQLKPEPPLTGYDEGAAGHYNLGIDIIPIEKGGTGAATVSEAWANLATDALKNVISVIGPPPTDDMILTIVKGVPQWSLSQVGASRIESFVTTEKSLALPNAQPLSAGDGITVNGAKIGLQPVVARQDYANVFNKPQTAPALGLKGALYITTIATDDPPADQTINVPAVGNSSFVLTEGDATINGVKRFGDLRILTNVLITESGIQQFQDSGVIVNLKSPQTLANKTFNGILIENVPPQIRLRKATGVYNIDCEEPGANRAYRFYNANTDADIALKSGALIPGGVMWTNGNVCQSTNVGSKGLALISNGASVPTFDVLQTAGGGTGIIAYAPGDLLIGTAKGLQRLPVGKIGQVLTVTAKGIEWQ